MRKDVRFGLAIGGVLLAVLVVYVLVVPVDNAPRSAATKPPANPAPVAVDPTPAPAPNPVAVTPAPTDPRPDDAVASNTPQTPVARANPVEQRQTNNAPDWAQLLAYGQQQQPAVSQTPAREPAVATPDRTMPDRGATDRTIPDRVASDRAADSTANPPVAEPMPAPRDPSVGPHDPTPAAAVYVVKTGDTLSSIARDAYGSPNYYPHIQRANPNLDPHRLRPGMKINLPDRASVVVEPAAARPAAARTDAARPADNAAAATVDAKTQYTVQPGDSLHRISVKLYGDSSHADQLYEANKALIGADPARLKVAMVLTLPTPPTIAQAR